jgi:GT2 family glycosyltransferase
MAKYTVIIPNWNGLEYIGACLSSLRDQTYDHHVIVVENGSTDGSNEFIRTNFPEVELLEFSNNAGFAGGVNRGIRPALESGANGIVLLNNDAIAEPRWLERLVTTLEANPTTGIVTSKIMRLGTDQLDSTGEFYSIWGFSYPRGRDEVDKKQYDKEQVVFGCSGGASIYRATMLEEIGLFDETFFAYYEDVDLSFRARLAGWEARFEPSAIVSHHIGGTSSKHGTFGRYYTIRNFIFTYTKNMPGKLYGKYLWRIFFSYAMMAGSDIRRGQFGTFLRATISGVYHLPEMLQKRRKIQANRKVSLDVIEGLLYRQMPPTQRVYLAVLRRLRIPNTTKQ